MSYNYYFMSDLKISEFFLKEKVIRQYKSLCTLSKCTVAANAGKIQIPILLAVEANNISVFLDLLTVKGVTNLP